MATKDFTGERRRYDVPFIIKDTTDPDQEMALSGHGSVFGVIDYYQEEVKKGAFKKSLGEHKKAGTMPAMLWQHLSSQVPGVWTKMHEDDIGLYNEGHLLPTTLGKDAHILLKARAITGLSIGFNINKWEFDEETQILTIKEVDLWEVSLVTFPANSAARIEQVKQIGNVRDFEVLLREAGFSRGDAKIIVAKGFKHLMDEREAALQGDDSGLRALAAALERNATTLKA